MPCLYPPSPSPQGTQLETDGQGQPPQMTAVPQLPVRELDGEEQLATAGAPDGRTDRLWPDHSDHSWWNRQTWGQGATSCCSKSLLNQTAAEHLMRVSGAAKPELGNKEHSLLPGCSQEMPSLEGETDQINSGSLGMTLQTLSPQTKSHAPSYPGSSEVFLSQWLDA